MLGALTGGPCWFSLLAVVPAVVLAAVVGRSEGIAGRSEARDVILNNAFIFYREDSKLVNSIAKHR